VLSRYQVIEVPAAPKGNQIVSRRAVKGEREALRRDEYPGLPGHEQALDAARIDAHQTFGGEDYTDIRRHTVQTIGDDRSRISLYRIPCP